MPEEIKIHGWWTREGFIKKYKERYPGQTIQSKIDYEWDRFRRAQEEWSKDDWVFFLDILDGLK